MSGISLGSWLSGILAEEIEFVPEPSMGLEYVGRIIISSGRPRLSMGGPGYGDIDS